MSTQTRRSFLHSTAGLAAAGLVPGICPAGVLAARGALTQPHGHQLDDKAAFLQAAAKGDLPTVKKLLTANGEFLQTQDVSGRSAYALALLAGHAPVAEYLKSAGFESDAHEAALALDWDRFSALTAEGTDETMELLNSNHPVGGTAMFAAAAGGAGMNIWRVYSPGGNPNARPRGRSGVSAVQAALRFADLPTAEMTAATLLGNNADPNPRNDDAPPLHIAADRGSPELVEMLIRLGARVEAVDERGRTAEQAAATAGHESIAAMIARHKQIPRTCRTSRTAFDATGQKYAPADLSDVPYARRGRVVGVSHGDLDAVKSFVSADARLAHSVATTSEICVEAGAHIGRQPIVDFLLDHGAPYSLPTAVMRGDFDTAKKYLDDDPDRIHERGAHDFALLWYPIIGRCEPDMMALLLERGANVEKQHFLGTTALHWACRFGRIELVDLLIDAGADVNRAGRKFGPEGETPLQAANAAGQDAIADLLKSRGARQG